MASNKKTMEQASRHMRNKLSLTHFTSMVSSQSPENIKKAEVFCFRGGGGGGGGRKKTVAWNVLRHFIWVLIHQGFFPHAFSARILQLVSTKKISLRQNNVVLYWLKKAKSESFIYTWLEPFPLKTKNRSFLYTNVREVHTCLEDTKKR